MVRADVLVRRVRVELTGPVRASVLQTAPAPYGTTCAKRTGAETGDRTRGLILTMDALCRLSYLGVVLEDFLVFTVLTAGLMSKNFSVSGFDLKTKLILTSGSDSGICSGETF